MTSTLGSTVDLTVSLYDGSIGERVALAFAIESPLQAITICPPGTTKTFFPVEREGDGDTGGTVGDSVADGDTEAKLDVDAGLLAGTSGLALTEAGGGGDVFVEGLFCVAGGVVLAGSVVERGCEVDGCGLGDGGLDTAGDAETTGETPPVCRAAAADAEFWLTCADTPSGVTTLGVAPDTSWPTRSTAVKVTAVTSAHDMIQPIASVSGRVDQVR